MLLELRVRNLALVEDAVIRLEPGLNVVTGATGAGKSLLLLALGLLLGGRWSREMLRTGADRMEVRGVFEIDDPALAAQCLALSDETADDEGPLQLVVSRRVDAAGRNRAEIQGTFVPVGSLRALCSLLAEIHGQSEHQALVDPARQTELLDRAAGLADDRTAFAERLRTWRAGRVRLAELTARDDQRQARIETLEAIIAEVEEVAPEDGESDRLRRERELLAAAERHSDALSSATALIDGGHGDADPAIDLVGRASRTISDAAALSDEVAAAQESLDRAADALSEATRLLADALERLEADPERLERLQGRLEELGSLLRRHGPTEADALAAAESARSELASLRGDSDAAEQLHAEVADLASGALQAGTELDDARRKAGITFSAGVEAGLAELEMDATRFAVHVPTRRDTALDAASPAGLGPVEWRVAPNRGEELRPLARIASGGELARTALAIKGELADADRVPILAFDEIDADVGARLGSVIGRRLSALSIGRQVLVVTHLPQVAAFAARHLRVHKQERGERTVVQVEALAGAERELEIAEMIRGAGHAEEARDQARAMLAEAAAAGVASSKAVVLRMEHAGVPMEKRSAAPDTRP